MTIEQKKGSPQQEEVEDQPREKWSDNSKSHSKGLLSKGKRKKIEGGHYFPQAIQNHQPSLPEGSLSLAQGSKHKDIWLEDTINVDALEVNKSHLK